MAEPIRVDSVSRRTVLKGMAGAAGLISIPAIIAACSSSSATTAPSEAPSAAPSEAAPSVAPSEAAPSVAPGSITVGSNYSDAVPKKVFQDIIDTFTQQTGITVKVNTVDHGTFQD